MMGSPKEEIGRKPNEILHRVTLSRGFYMGVHLVTQEQWRAVIGGSPSQFSVEDNLPVEQISWENCQDFIKVLRQADNKPYRLPTEAEWEYACRAGTTTPFYFGETISTDLANYNGDIVYGTGRKGVFRQKTTPVGSFPANAWGLHDMHGNLFQWCQDWMADYPEGEAVDPQGPITGQTKVIRGGCWGVYGPAGCRSAFRTQTWPTARESRIGFRLCYSLE